MALRVLVVGSRKLYLQALCELLCDRHGLQARLVYTKHALRDPSGLAPHVVVVDVPAGDDETAPLVKSLRGRHPTARVVVLTSAGARESRRLAASVEAGGWASLARRAADLAVELCPRARPANVRRPRSPSTPSLLDQLTKREMSVLDLVVSGETRPAIAEALGISPNTVRTHIQNIMAKLLVSSRTELVALALESGLRQSARAGEADRWRL